MPDAPCPYFFAAACKVSGCGMVHALPLYRCGLTEEALERLQALAPYADIAACYAIGAPVGGRCTLCGPDMGPVSPRLCRSARLEDYCLPAFTILLTEWGGDPTPRHPPKGTAVPPAGC